MTKLKLMILLFGIIFFTQINFATSGCSERVYRNACANCQFDVNGKIDSACSENYKQSGITCVSTTYPIMSAKYAAGECPAVGTCSSQLQSCIAQMQSGNDKQDCSEGSVGMCYATADLCIQKASNTCAEIVPPNPCWGSTSLILLIGGLVFVGYTVKY
ncbi:hypothetical protein KO465_00355 [Candidatus Micrarchaeota archaeon]|jgi:hypothetical protein|nr:hypothetical protein [Candidatus Micrarchaeota archaeon]